MADKFAGFLPPTENYSKLPHQMIEALPLVETVSELKVILYVLRHTWGFQEFDELKRITLDEFQRGRKRKDGSRFDKGTGLSANAIKDGITRAIKHGFLIRVSDGRDFGRSSHVYQLRVSNSDTVSDSDSQPSNSDTQPSEVDSQPSDLDTRSEKETLERNPKKEAKKEVAIFPEKPKERTDDEETGTDHPAGRIGGDGMLGVRTSQPAKTAGTDGSGSDGDGDGLGDSVDVPDMWELARRTAAARAQSGGNYATPGGAFALGDRLVTAACARLGRSEPEGDKRKSALAFFEKALKAERLSQGNPDMLVRAVRDWLDPEGEYAFFRSQYDLSPKHELALRHFGIVLSTAKKADADASARRARAEADNEASQEAWEERQASKPFVELPDQMPWTLTMNNLEAQVSQTTFFMYYQGTRLLSLDDGMAIVEAKDEVTRDWLQARAGVIGREMSQVLGRAVEVRFEVEG